MTDKKDSNKSLVKSSDKSPTQVQISSPDLTYIKKLVAEVSSGPLVKPFLIEVDGKQVVDEAAIIANMVLGKEMGFDYMASLAMGTTINAKTYLSVKRGKELGIGNLSSMAKIYHIPTNKGASHVISLAKDIIIAKIIESGTTINYIRKYEPTPMYKTMDGEYLGHRHLIFDKDDNLLPSYFLFVDGVHSTEEVAKVMKSGKVIILQSGITFVSSVQLVRKSKSIDETFHYSIQEAIDANLHRGNHSTLVIKGKPLYIDGKANWNNHPATHCNGRVLDLAGRIVVADVLMGNYSHEETIDILNNPNIKTVNDLADYAETVKPENIEIEIKKEVKEDEKKNV